MPKKVKKEKKAAQCKTCGCTVPSKAKKCPMCGSKIKKPLHKKWWFWLFAFFVFVGMFGETEEPETNQDHENDTVISDGLNTEADSATPNGMQSDSQEPDKAEPPDKKPIVENSTFEVHYIDVGQADAALVLCDGKTMLIDGGNSEDSSLIYSYLKQRNLEHLDYIIATHAHEDHVGGLAGALNYATVDTAYSPVTTYDSDAFSAFVKYLGETNITVPTSGDSFELGSAAVKILAPVKSYDDTNNTSIILRIEYGDTSFLFTGDAEREAEQDILDAGYNLKSTVLKVGHHGANTSTTYPFLREIMPEYAVISVGTGNSYGHPTEDTLSRLRDADVKVFRTDMQGTIICTSDGKKVSFSVEKNKDADTLKEPGLPKDVTVNVGDSSSVKEEVAPKPEQSIPVQKEPEQSKPVGTSYVLNTNTKKFHYTSCSSVKKMSEKNKAFYTGNRTEVISMGYDPCGNCHP